MAWIIFLLIISFKEALSQYQSMNSNPEFGQDNWSPQNFYATVPPLPKRPLNSNGEQVRPSDLYDMEDKITRAGKWPEFIAKVKETGNKVKGSVMKNWQEDVYKWASWVKGLESPAGNKREIARQRPPLVRIEKSEEKPSLGMEMYWGKDDENLNAPPPRASPPRASPPRGPPPPASAQRSRPEYNGPGQSYMRPGGPGNVPPPPNGGGGGGTSGVPNQIEADDMMNMAQKRIDFLLKQQQYGSPNLEGIPPAGLENPYPFGERLPKSTDKVKKPSESDLIKFAFSKLHQVENMLRTRELEINGTNTTDSDPLSALPKVDDFNSPIRWVPFNSEYTADGIAKLTDNETKKNKQITVNGTIYVPVVDYDLKRLGLTITTEPKTVSPAILAMYRASTEASVLQTVIDNVNMKQPDQTDWLAFETIMGGDRSELMCEGSHCQARCRKLGCQTMCDGDTCAAGCVGPACNSMCKGVGCSSMCIGKGCIARCDGQSCDARCRGKDCEAACQKPSCYFTINGKAEVSRGNWNDYYLQHNSPPDGNYE